MWLHLIILLATATNPTPAQPVNELAVLPAAESKAEAEVGEVLTHPPYKTQTDVIEFAVRDETRKQAEWFKREVDQEVSGLRKRLDSVGNAFNTAWQAAKYVAVGLVIGGVIVIYMFGSILWRFSSLIAALHETQDAINRVCRALKNKET